jgi:hypothetical protein
LTPQQRQLRASLGAESQWARETDRSARTAKARQAANDRFQRQIDEAHPDVDPATRAKMAENLRRAHFKRMALASSRARSRKAAGDGRPT